MDLPTYTSIWRIEKRLYKLYDFRLPMPLPVGQIAVFTGIAVPYLILLTLFGLPFNHNLFWLYVLPPGVLTWLATRPVLESKRLPELIISQVRYLGEPRTWCRLAPLAEKDEVQVVARVWRRRAPVAADLAVEPTAPALQPLPQPLAALPQPLAALPQAQEVLARAQEAPPQQQQVQQQKVLPQRQEVLPREAPPLAQPVPAHAALPEQAGLAGTGSGPALQWPDEAGAASPPRRRAVFPLPGPSQLPRPAGPGRPAVTPPPPGSRPGAGAAAPAAGPAKTAAEQEQPGSPPARNGQAAAAAAPAGAAPAGAAPAGAAPAGPLAAAAALAAAAEPSAAEPSAAEPSTGEPRAAEPSTAERTAAAPGGQPEPGVPNGPVPSPRPAPQVRIVAAGPAPARPARQVERVLGGPAGQRSMSWRDHVTVVPGGRGPGQPDQIKRERARATAALDGPRLVVVLGCTVGAGQTVTALMVAELLAKLRAEPVAALDLNPGPASLAGQVQTPPAATVAALLAGRDGGRAAPHSGGQGSGRLDVIAQDLLPGGPRPAGEQDHQRLFGILADRYPLVVVDPGAMAVARALAAADQLVLVAPASPDAARATAMTLEWLDGNGYTALVSGAVAVMNGVSKRSATHAEQAEGVVRGRCRAIVRVPWDDHLGVLPAERGIPGPHPGPRRESRLDQLRPPVLDAYTALAGVLISGLVAAPANGKAAP